MRPIKNKQPVRSYSGINWVTNATNKKYLAPDFDFRCGYCDDLDTYSGGYNTYHVEHFAPKDKFEELEFEYENLLYCCPYCNISKSNKWVGRTSDECVIGEKGFIDPCRDEYYTHLGRDDEGNIIYHSPLGEYIYSELKLYLKRHSILHNIDRLRDRRLALKEKIVEKNNLGMDTHKLNQIYALLSDVLCDYYELFLKDEERVLI